MENLNEPVLADDHPVYAGYLYIADNKVVQSMVEGNIRSLKRDLKVHEGLEVEEIRRCDINGRNLWHLAM